MEAHKATGKLINVSEVVSGTGKSGKDWQKIDFLVDTGERFNNIYPFVSFNPETIQSIPIMSEVAVEFEVSANEFKGKHYINLSAKKVTVNQAAKQAPPKDDYSDFGGGNFNIPTSNQSASDNSDDDSDLPF